MKRYNISSSGFILHLKYFLVKYIIFVKYINNIYESKGAQKMDLLQMKYIVAIAESESMTQAAERLNVSQSALSLSYKRLQDELGIPLFRRQGRRLQLTDAGTFFCRNASMILGQVDKLAYDMSTLRGSGISTVVYTSEAGDFTNESRLLYQKLFPERDVVEVRETTRETLESLRRGRAAFAITYEDNTDDFLTSELLLEEPMYAFLSARSPLAEHRELSMEQLRSLPLISQREEYTVAQIMRRFYTHSSTMPGRTFFVGDPESITMQVYNGVGITFVPESVVNFWHKVAFPMAKGTRMIPMSNRICQRRLFLTYPQAGLFPDETSYYMEYIRRFSKFVRENRSFPTLPELQGFFAVDWPDFSAMKQPALGL